MDKEWVAFVKGCIAFLLVTGTAMTGLRFWFKWRQLPRREPDADLVAMRDEHARLEAELGSRIVDLEERLDFVERRLVQEQRPARLPEPPKAKTPV